MKTIKYNSAKKLYPNQSSKSNRDEFIIKGNKDIYKLTETIGKGTFGKVKLAFSIKNPKIKYACKLLEKSNIIEEDDLKRCIREMAILLKMEHPNVIKTYEIVSDSMRYYIIMEYCSKGELFDLIIKENHFNEKKSAFFFYQIISGVEYIHSKYICHRDLKPENLLLNSDEELKIIDFGLSNYKERENNYLLKTPCGSPCYASPEMILGKKYDGFGIDVWSTGIILFAMLCGYLPFEEGEGATKNEVLFKNIVKCKINYPEQFVSKNAKNLLQKIIVRNPKERITIKEIKKHPFFLMGKNIYLNKYGIIRNKTIENIKGSFSLRNSMNLNLNLEDKNSIANNKISKSNKTINVNKKNLKTIDTNLISIESKENSNYKFNTYNNSTRYYIHTNYDRSAYLNKIGKNIIKKELLVTSVDKEDGNLIDKRYFNLKGININSRRKKHCKSLRNKISINHAISTNYSGRNKKVTNYNFTNFNTLENKSNNQNLKKNRNFPKKMRIFQKSIKELNLKNNDLLYNVSNPKNLETTNNNNCKTNHDNNTEIINFNNDINKKYIKTEANFWQTKSFDKPKVKKNKNINLYGISFKYINTIINTLSNNQMNSNNKRNKNKTTERKSKINFSKTSLNTELQPNNTNKNIKRENKSSKTLKMKYISNLDKNDNSEKITNKNDKYTIKVRQFSKYIKTKYNTNRGKNFKDNNFNSINKNMFSCFNTLCSGIKKRSNYINRNIYNEYQIKKILKENEKNEKIPLNLNKMYFSNGFSMNQNKNVSKDKIYIKHTALNNKNINNISNNFNLNTRKTSINYNLTSGNHEHVKSTKDNDTEKKLSKKSSYHYSSRIKNKNSYLSNKNIDRKFANKKLDLPTEICFNKNEYNTNSKNIQTNQNDINNNKIVINLNILKPKIFVDKYKNNISTRSKNHSSNLRNNMNNVQKKKKSKNYETKKETQFSFIETFLKNVINNQINSKSKKY